MNKEAFNVDNEMALLESYLDILDETFSSTNQPS